jgi:uncharacterized protein (DUF1810 family)
VSGRTAEQIFCGIDALKLRSSMTLFRHADPQEPAFRRVLDQYFGGKPDPATCAHLMIDLLVAIKMTIEFGWPLRLRE